MTLSDENPMKTVFIYDSTSTSQVVLLAEVKTKTKVKTVVLNHSNLTVKLLNELVRKMQSGAACMLINENSPWYRCFSNDINEMSESVLIQTLTEYPSLLKTPIVVHEDEVLIDPTIEHIFDVYEDMYV
ncbi:hypothetical protein KMW28_05370 [Flammeovirga yaeyamensis]|uniref:Arsenate reductase n=1 Tax=Flammeovirga yaeyamensis TaxID=367791 RepID=A0AAX1N9A5_9BACT|nr:MULTISPECIES: ArsC/Spx/MgsR family protein [Flammeovirga]ANQ49504.1 hypothetical protein MY04_2130 [Flammeovirga sp. MY04]MBB3697594.1 arsenate reductase-like glutaredoxin family protein [Flammeovirga yaeyamensis]NMF36284.1 hypothetical protein [Flammeovirga yaeyamensis]QWG03011.1 hypothetical protein KMW28_05370 [Flammeovirga yaeyamensis]